MTYTYTKEGGPAYAALLAFLGGWIELGSGLFNLGNSISDHQRAGQCYITAIQYMYGF